MDNKRAKQDGKEELVNPNLLTEEARHKFRKAYEEAQPYPHCVFDPICNKEAFARVRDEIVENLETKYKETDLFKLYQTTDLASIDDTQPELAAKLPTLLKLRDQLYSKEFRQLISDVTGCGELTERVDMAASAYSHGSHLLCHDDVIGTRAVSFILYFSHEGWSKEEGGALELYPLDPKSIVKREAEGNEGAEMLVQGVPEPHPTVRHLPLFNTMAFFRVMPGRSYHSVQEVLSDGSPRLSIQGWFHGPSEPVGNDMASLNQLKTAAELADPFDSIASTGDVQAEASKKEGTSAKETEADADAKAEATGVEAAELSDEDLAYLRRFVNATYLKKDAMTAVERQFEQDSSVQLQQFLKVDVAARIKAETFVVDEEQDLLKEILPPNETGVGGKWQAVGPAHMQRYLRYTQQPATGTAAATAAATGADAEDVTPTLGSLETKLFRSPAFLRYLAVITGGRLLGVRLL